MVRKVGSRQGASPEVCKKKMLNLSKTNAESAKKSADWATTQKCSADSAKKNAKSAKKKCQVSKIKVLSKVLNRPKKSAESAKK